MRPISKVLLFSLGALVLFFALLFAGQPSSEFDFTSSRGEKQSLIKERRYETKSKYESTAQFALFNNDRTRTGGVLISNSGTASVNLHKQTAFFDITDDFLVNDDSTETGDNQQLTPAIARAPSGAFIIAWVDLRTTYWDVYAQRYDSSATPVGPIFKVNDVTAGADEPAVAMNDAGNFVITWRDLRDDGFFGDIYAQRYDSAGIPLNTNFKVNDDPLTNFNFSPDVVMDSSGAFIIVWADGRNGTNNYDIYAQRYNASGNPVGVNFKVNDDTGYSWQSDASIAMKQNGEFVVTWEDYRHDSYPPKKADIFAQRYDTSGIPLGSNFRVNDDTLGLFKGWPDVALDKSGNFTIIWKDGYEDAVYAQRFDSSGTPINSNFRVNDDTITVDYPPPAIATNCSGQFIITWGRGDSPRGVYAQIYDSTGSPLGANVRVTPFGILLGGDFYPDVASDCQGNSVVTWKDCRNSYSNLNASIYAQRFDFYGNPVGTNFKVGEEKGVANQYHPQIAVDDSGNFFVVWLDGRYYGLHIYAQRYDSSGVAVGTNFKVNDDSATCLEYPVVAMSGSGSSIVVWRYFYSIYAQRFDSTGADLGGNYKVNESEAAPYPVSVAMNDLGNYVIVWTDPHTGKDIYAQIGKTYATERSSNFRVNDDGDYAAQYSCWNSTAMDDHGNFVIAWVDYRTGTEDVFAQRYDSSGTPVGSNFIVNEKYVSNGIQPAVDMDGSGGFIIAWQTNFIIYAQRFDSEGNRLGSPFVVNDDSVATRGLPDISIDKSSGNFVISWGDYRNGNSDIYAQIYDGAGNPIGSNFLVNDQEYAGFKQIYPSVEIYGFKIFFVWEDNRRPNGWDIYGKIVEFSIPGDINHDGTVSIADVVYLINYLMKSGMPPINKFSIADVNCFDDVTIADVVYLINYLFKDGPKPNDPNNDGIPDC